MPLLPLARQRLEGRSARWNNPELEGLSNCKKSSGHGPNSTLHSMRLTIRMYFAVPNLQHLDSLVTPSFLTLNDEPFRRSNPLLGAQYSLATAQAATSIANTV